MLREDHHTSANTFTVPESACMNTREKLVSGKLRNAKTAVHQSAREEGSVHLLVILDGCGPIHGRINGQTSMNLQRNGSLQSFSEFPNLA
jgi:hypothetical protein